MADDEIRLERVADPKQLVHALRGADDVMRICGWRLLDAAVNCETGFVRLIAESRDKRAGEGVKLTILRSTAGARVVIERSRIAWRSGFYTSGWEVADWLGSTRVDDLGEAVETMLHYVCGNSAAGAVSEALAGRRRQMFARHFAMLRPAQADDALARYSLDGGSITGEWEAELDRVCCRGDGWDPYIPSVTAGDDCDVRRWVATSGTIVDGRGVHREGTYARGPLL